MTSALQHFWAGRWDDALAELSALADQSGEPGPLQLDNLDNIELRLPYHGLLALIAVCRDDRDTVRRCPKHGPVDGSEILSVCDYGDLMCAAHARSAERSGDLVGAVASLGPIAERPPGRLSKIHHWLPDLVRIALAAGMTRPRAPLQFGVRPK